jgi:tRNA-2-methylthio-N6-dimethylallyladenosine synthase
MNRYWIETYGCQMNKAESNALEQELLDNGWTGSERPEEADLVLINTCSVRITAEDRIWGRIGYYKALKRTHPHTLVLLGCMAERLKNEIKRIAPTVDMVVGTFQKESFLRVLQQARSAAAADKLEEISGYRFARTHSKGRSYKAFVPIMHGCNNFCSYCIVPHVRGREVSRPPEEIFEEISLLREQGVKEVTLLGQNVNSFSFSDGKENVNFPTLLRKIIGKFPDLSWLRFLTSHPKDVSPDLIRCIAENPALCRHIHLPVQHGSNRILSAMDRKYTREEYLELIEKIKSAIPGVSLSTDILVGFPGESEDDFLSTLDLMRTVRYDDAFMYYYNPREGTPAFHMEDSVPDRLKLERLGAVIELQRAITGERKKERLGTRLPVLVEEISKKNKHELLSRTERDEMVVFPGNPQTLGSFVTVELIALKGKTFVAREVS